MRPWLRLRLVAAVPNGHLAEPHGHSVPLSKGKQRPLRQGPLGSVSSSRLVRIPPETAVQAPEVPELLFCNICCGVCSRLTPSSLGTETERTELRDPVWASSVRSPEAEVPRSTLGTGLEGGKEWGKVWRGQIWP